MPSGLLKRSAAVDHYPVQADTCCRKLLDNDIAPSLGKLFCKFPGILFMLKCPDLNVEFSPVKILVNQLSLLPGAS